MDSNKQNNTVQRELSNRQVQMIALGGTIGTGLFLGAGRSISTAGPSILLIYAIVGIILFWMMRALGEMLVFDPSKTTFVNFIEKYLGKRAGFVIGWSYWLSWIAVAMSEATAIGEYMNYWFPNIPKWSWQLLFIIVLFSVNIIAVRLFGEFEFWFAMIKIIAILALIVVGAWMIFVGFKTSQGSASLTNLFSQGVFAKGTSGFFSGFQMAFFAFLGIEFVGITAAETKDPKTIIPKAINSIIVRILIFYIGALTVLMSVMPFTSYNADTSPFVQVFTLVHINAAAGIVNFVVLTAASSSLSSSLFATGRMLLGLAQDHQNRIQSGKKGITYFLSRISKSGVPMNAIVFSTALIAVSVIASALLPDAFLLITSAASAIGVVVYGTIVLAHLKYRNSEDYIKGEKAFKMPFSPISNYITIAFMALIFVILLLTPSMQIPALFALIWLGVVTIMSLVLVKDSTNKV